MGIRRLCATLGIVGAFIATSYPMRAADAPPFSDEFEGPALDASWIVRDGYAEANPSDTANHATVTVNGTHLSISFPSGVEHNMWLQLHTQVTRAYEGSGVYEIEQQTPVDGSQQFGLVFENSPGNFLIFMLYGRENLWGYAERFTYVNGIQYKATFPGSGDQGHNTGLVVPDPGPYRLRVIVADDPLASNRSWKCQWSTDGASWTTIVNGVLEGDTPETGIGTIERVGLFAGNHPYDLSAFDAWFDFFRVSPVSELPIDVPGGLTARAGDRQVALSWNAVDDADAYAVYRSTTPGGPYALLATAPVAAYVDTAVVNETFYAYVVTTIVGANESAQSAEVHAIPHLYELAPALPLDGLALVLDAAELGYVLSDGEAVTTWSDATGASPFASGVGSGAPRFVPDGINGLPAVRFDGIDDQLALSPGFEDFTAGATLFVVAHTATLQTGFKLLLLGNGPGVANVGFGRYVSTAGVEWFTSNGGGSFGGFSTPSGVAAGDTAVYSIVQAAGAAGASVSATISRDGDPLGTGNALVPPVTTRSANYIGRSYWASDGRFQGDVAEILLYLRALSAGENSAVVSHLLEKYGLDGGPATLPAPTGLEAVAGAGKVELGWQPVSGAIGYRLHRSDGPGGPHSPIHLGAAAAFTDTTVSNGATYGYVVTALDETSESVFSAEVVATPMATGGDAPNGGAVAIPRGTPVIGLEPRSDPARGHRRSRRGP